MLEKINNAEDPICDVKLDNSVISMNMIFDSLEDVKLVFKFAGIDVNF